MTPSKFVAAVKLASPIRTVIENPRGGTSTIVGYSDTNVSYVRGRSTIAVAFSDLYETYANFNGQHVSSTELRAFRPSVFDSAARPAGHSCNCTFLFRVLERLNLSGPITGSGVRGNPYAVTVSGGGPV